MKTQNLSKKLKEAHWTEISNELAVASFDSHLIYVLIDDQKQLLLKTREELDQAISFEMKLLIFV